MSAPDSRSTPQQRLLELLHRVTPVEARREPVELADAVGRVLAGPLYEKGDAPPPVVSAPGGCVSSGADRPGVVGEEGEVVVQQGELISASTCVALASFGVDRPQVRPPLRTAVIVVGEALDDRALPLASARPRDVNGPGLAALLRSLRWIELTWRGNVDDRLDSITGALAGALRGNDAVLITSGTSSRPEERVAAAVRAAGCDVALHQLPVRAGEAVLAAVGERDQLVIALPADPVSALLLTSFLCVPALQKRAGFARVGAPSRLVYLDDPCEVSPDIWCFNLVRVASDGRARSVPSRGSADIVSAARADGFVLVPPGAAGSGPWPFFVWGP